MKSSLTMQLFFLIHCSQQVEKIEIMAVIKNKQTETQRSSLEVREISSPNWDKSEPKSSPALCTLNKPAGGWLRLLCSRLSACAGRWGGRGSKPRLQSASVGGRTASQLQRLPVTMQAALKCVLECNQRLTIHCLLVSEWLMKQPARSDEVLVF